MINFLKKHALFICILLLSIPIKFAAAQNMSWDIDIVPVVSRNVEYVIPPVGTLASVAAYNLPMLEWLHLPAQWLTGDVWWTIFLTMLIFNLLSTTALYASGLSMFNQRVAIVAAALFTFSEVGISSSYTAWAQLLLPGFFAMLIFCLWRWVDKEEGFWLAAAGVIASAAFMTHFSALLLYPAMLVFALVTRAKWQIRWLIAGAIAVILMFTPYVLVQIERDFIDIKAFASQEPLVTDEVLAQYEIYKPGYNAPIASPQNDSSTQAETPETAPQVETTPQVRPRWLRAIDYARKSPRFFWRAMTTAFVTRTPGISEVAPALTPFTALFLSIPKIMLVLSLIAASIGYIREFPKNKSLTASQSGQLLLLAGFLTLMIALMILTRTIENSSYWMGFMSIEYLIAAYAVSFLPDSRRMTILIVIGLTAYAGLQTTERALRLIQHDDSEFSPYNVSIYRHVEKAVDYIAEDWEGGETITVSYDILQDVRNLWWTPAWNSIDPSYTMGMNFDFLLSYHHGLENTNTDPIGTVDNADYIILYTPSLENYDLEDYVMEQFGTIVVLKPMR